MIERASQNTDKTKSGSETGGFKVSTNKRPVAGILDEMIEDREDSFEEVKMLGEESKSDKMMHKK